MAEKTHIRTQGICGLQKTKFGQQEEFSAAGIMVTLRTKLARRKGTFVRKNRFRAKVERGPRTAGTRQEGKMDSKDLGCGRQYLRLRSMEEGDEIYRKSIRVDLGERVASSFVTSWKVRNRTTLRSPPPLERKIKEWTLWRGRPPPKRKKTY
jgi:hypothetical protein